MKLRHVQQYLKMHVELVFTLIDGTTSNILAAHVVKTEEAEGVFVVDVEGTFPSEPKERVPASTSASTSIMIFPLSHYA